MTGNDLVAFRGNAIAVLFFMALYNVAVVGLWELAKWALPHIHLLWR